MGFSGSPAPVRCGGTCTSISGNGRQSYRQFRRWSLAGLCDLLLQALNETEGVGESVQMIDSTIVRGRQCAAGAKGGLRVRVLGTQESWLGLSEQCVRFDKWNPYQVQGAAICGSRLK